MTTIKEQKNLVAERFEAEVREAESRLKVLQAQAEARQAKRDMDEISGLATAKERVKRDVAAMKRQASDDYAAAQGAVEQGLATLQADITRLNQRYASWDAARERQFYARLDEADAKLKVWEAKTDRKLAEHGMKRDDELARLEEKIALARTRAAAARHEKYTAKAQAALEEAAQYFDQAYEAAAKRYGPA
jgi:hypothetical protein